MVSVAIIVVVALGTLNFQYHGAKHSRISEAQVTATNLGQLLLEDWKSTAGDDAYDPTTLGLGFQTPIYVNPGYYIITLDNQTFYMLLNKQIAPVANNPDNVAGVELDQLRVSIRWRPDFTPGALTVDDPVITLTTYVRKD